MIVGMAHIGADHNLSEDDDAEDVIATVQTSKKLNVCCMWHAVEMRFTRTSLT